jgi:hypothetical protein
MARILYTELYTEDGFTSYDDGGQFEMPSSPGQSPTDPVISQVTPMQITADQNNYTLPAQAEIIRLFSDASRTITGFTGARAGAITLCNVGSFNIVIANNNAGSDAQNRVLCHTGANITLQPNMSVNIWYDFMSEIWRTTPC